MNATTRKTMTAKPTRTKITTYIQGLFINDVRERERDVSEIGSSHNKKLFGGFQKILDYTQTVSKYSGLHL